MYERYSEARNLMVQYWPESIFGTDLDMQNPILDYESNAE